MEKYQHILDSIEKDEEVSEYIIEDIETDEGLVTLRIEHIVTQPSFSGDYDTPPHGFKSYLEIVEERITKIEDKNI